MASQGNVSQQDSFHTQFPDKVRFFSDCDSERIDRGYIDFFVKQIYFTGKCLNPACAPEFLQEVG
jgi:hypothetical protein